MDWDLILIGVALVLALIAQFQAKGQSLLAYAVIALAVALLPLQP